MPEVTDVFPNCLPCCGGGSVCHNGAIWFNPASHASPGVCPNELDNTKKVCLHFELTSNITPATGRWAPPSPVGCDYYADCQNLLKPKDINAFYAQYETSPVHPDYVTEGRHIFGSQYEATLNTFETLPDTIIGQHILNSLSMPWKLGYRYSIPGVGFIDYGTYYFGKDPTDGIYAANLRGDFTCSPFTWTSDQFDVFSNFVNYGEYQTYRKVGTATIKITKTLCSTVTPIIKTFSPVPVPVVSQATTPCKHLGANIQDPASCNCGTAILRHCSVYGACRVTGTSTAGEGICLTCPDYQAP